LKSFLIGIFIFLGIFTTVVISLIPAKVISGKKPVIWTTDPNPQRDPQVDAYNKMFPDQDLSIDPDNSGVMKVVVQSSAGMGPDVIGHVNAGTMQTYHEAGILMDITEEAKKMGFSADTMPESVRPFVMLQELNDKGEIVEKQYTYPCNVYHTYLFYNKNIFDKYNIPYPSEDITWEEYINICKKLTIFSDDDDIPTIFGGTGANINIMIWGKGGKFLNKDGTRCMLNTKEVADAIEFYHDLFFKHGIEPSPTQKAGVSSKGGWGSGNISWFGEEKVSMLWGARWMLIQIRRFIADQKKIKAQWIKDNPDAKEYGGPPVLRMGACLVPRFKGSKRYTTFGVRGAAINKKTKNKEGALKFLQYLSTAEYSKTINDGGDSKPGNEKYIKLDLFLHPDWPGEKQIHEMAIKSTPNGRMITRSFFVSPAVIDKNFKLIRDKVISDDDNDLSREEIENTLQNITDNINNEISKNIERNPKLKKIYNKLLENGAEKITPQKED
jgi:ABC-type glycerol-3-phosphate transport system substrate-binding protein